MYEASEGAHRLRKVRIYRNGQNADKADVVWTAKGHPHVPCSGGVGEAGGHINMFDTFENGEASTDTSGNVTYKDHDMLQDEIGAGYTLAHEWGHYFYGVYDEYELETTDVRVEPSIMTSQWNAARRRDNRWLNFSIANRGGGDYQNTLHTEQHRKHQASVWETLVRDPANDPGGTGGVTCSLGRRLRYGELASVAPGTNANPGINLPGTARDELDIIWMTENVVLEIVVDHSGSMGGDPGTDPNKIANVKTAAKLLVEQAGITNVLIGVIQFSDVVETVYPLTQVTNASVRAAIEAAIDSIASHGRTAAYDAAGEALSALQSLQTTNDTKVVFLLTDGLDNSSSISVNTVIANYQNAQVPLFTFGYGSDADAAKLQRMATETGGRYYSSPTALADISRAFKDAYASSASIVGVGTGTLSLGTNAQIIPFVVDASVKSLNLTFTHSGAPSAASVTLTDPNSVVVTPTSVYASAGETVYFFYVGTPTPGTWQMNAASASITASSSYQIAGAPGALTYTVNFASEQGSAISYPTPLVLRAFLQRELRIAGAHVTGFARLPDGSTLPLSFSDQGNGVYVAPFAYRQNGTHEFAVNFDNASNTAQFSYAGVNLTPRIGQTTNLPPPLGGLVGANFNRSASIQVVVSGAVAAPISLLSSTITPLIDRQTGLFYQTLVVTNDGAGAVSGLRLTVGNLATNVMLVGATGTNGAGEPYLEFTNTVPASGVLTLTLAFYSGNRVGPTPATTVDVVPVTPPLPLSGTQLSIARAYMRATDAKMVIEFATTPSRSYVVEYSSDMATWSQVLPPVTATGTWFVWVDAGPPFTESPPIAGSRFYRILLLP